MIHRRNTTDSNGSWSLCKYYYTHNTGSCDDILLYRKGTITRCDKQRNTNKRFSYPISFRDQRLFQLNKKEKSNQVAKRWSSNNRPSNNRPSNNRQKPNQVTRRWSSNNRRKSNKRNTLAGILSTLANNKNSNLLSDTLSGKNLDQIWEAIRSYQDIEEAGPSTTTTTTTATMELITPTTTAVDTKADNSTILMNSSIRTNNSLIENVPSSSAGQETIITIDEPQQEEETSQVVQHPNAERKETSSQKEKLLFLFGFLMFPLWWVGAWQYIIQQQDHKRIPKDREVFQILNCLMSLASLLLVGLMIGLTTVWA